MKKMIFFAIIIAVSNFGCNSRANNHQDSANNVDTVFVGPSENIESYKNSAVDAKSHYDKIRAARKAKEDGRYDDAIKIYNDALSSAGFSFERGVIYLNLAEIYFIKNDPRNESKYQLLLAENTGNKNVKKAALDRAEEIQKKYRTPSAGGTLSDS